MSQRHPNVLHVESADVRPMNKGRHNMQLRRLGGPAGSKALGAVHTTLAPGSLSFPLHAHMGNEEGIYVLSGTGVARIGEAKVAVGPGDWLSFPAGAEYAHQMINDGTVPLVYLCVSTMNMPDVVAYPDSGKVMATAADSSSPLGFRRVGLFREKDKIEDYWDGEPHAK